MKESNLKLIVNHSYYLLLPLLDLPKEFYSKIKSVNLNNYYDRSDIGNFNKRIYVFVDNTEELSEDIIQNIYFIKYEYVDEDSCIISFKIPMEYITDVLLVSIGDYSKTSKDFKNRIYDHFKGYKTTSDQLRKVLNPTDKDFIEKSKEYLMDILINKLTDEWGTMFDPIKETFHLNNFLKTK